MGTRAPSSRDFGVRRCCVPDCDTLLPRTHELPVCESCGVKIALAHIWEAERYSAVKTAQRERNQRQVIARREAYDAQSLVYYLSLPSGRVKIGYSTNMRERLSALGLVERDLLATEPGGRELEAERHHQFRSERMGRRHEDFDRTPRLQAHIDAVRAEHGRPVITGYIYVPHVD